MFQLVWGVMTLQNSAHPFAEEFMLGLTISSTDQDFKLILGWLGPSRTVVWLMNAMPRGFSWFFSGTDKGGAAPCEKEAIGTTAAATGHAVAMTVRASMSGTKVVWYKCQHVERGLYPFFVSQSQLWPMALYQ